MRTILIVIIFLFISVSLSAKPVEITFWHSLGFNIKASIEELVKEYNKLNPDVRVNPVFQGNFDEMQIKMLSAAVTRDLPDVAQMQVEWMDPYIQNGIIQPIETRIPEKDRTDIPQNIWELTSRDGHVYGIPFCISTTVFFYNKDMFENADLNPEKPPSTWEEMIETGKRIVEYMDRCEKGNNYALMLWIGGFYGIAPFFWANGGTLFSEDGKKVNLTSEEMVKTLTQICDLAFIHKIMPQNWSDWEAGQAFLTGNLIMGPFTSAAIAYGEQNLPWRLGVTHMPSINGKRFTVLSGSALVNLAQKKKVKAASLDFTLWLVNKKNTMEMHKYGYIPVRDSAIKSIECMAFDSENPNYKVPIESMDYARALPNHVEMYKINRMIRDMLQKIFMGEADLLTELKKAEDEINEMIK